MKATEIQPRRGLTASLAAKFELEPTVFLSTIKKTVMPSNATDEEVAAFLMVAKEYDLNPIMREIHAFPKKGGGIQTVVGIDGWIKIATRHPKFDGVEFDAAMDEDGHPESVTCRMYLKDCSRPVEATEYYSECTRGTEPWKLMPRRMLRHKALIQCARIAFGISGIMDEDEAETIRDVDVVVVEDGRAPSKAEEVRDKVKSRRKKETTSHIEDDSDPETAVPTELDGDGMVRLKWLLDAAAVENKKVRAVTGDMSFVEIAGDKILFDDMKEKINAALNG